MSKPYIFTPILLLALAAAAGGGAQSLPIDTSLASVYFQEAEAICKQDNGRLWSVSLCGPMLFVDRQTRAVVANQGDKQGNLTPERGLFVGKLPAQINIANTALDWAGVRWTMIVWPPSDVRQERANTMAHELWHRIQDEIGLPSSGPPNNHLDSVEGRIWLQLEWRALQKALVGRGPQRRQAIKDALIFRAYRRAIFPKAAAEERSLEMHEGLAEYTGMKLSGADDAARYAANHLRQAEKKDTFVRSFAYASGPAYGLLLDEAGIPWRKNLKPEIDLGALLEKAHSLKMPQNLKQEAEKASRAYAGDALRASETERENNRQRRVAMYRASLVDGPVLTLPLQRMSMEFDPNTLQPLDPVGTVYPTIRIVDLWGILTVSKGALINSTFTKIQVQAPASPGAQDLSGRDVKGEGWRLELNEGWAVAPGERKGDYVLKKKD